MVKIRYTGNKSYRYNTGTHGVIIFRPNSVTEVQEGWVPKLLQQTPAFQKADSVSKVKDVPELNVLSKPSKTVDEKEEAPEEQKPEKKEKVLKAKPKAKKPKLKKDKLRKKLQSKRSKK